MKLPWWLPIILAGLLAMGVGLAETTPNAVAEMLVSGRAEVVAEGERLLAAEQGPLFDRLLKEVASGDAKVSGRAAVELGILISPWLRGKEASARFVSYTNLPSPRRPVDRVPNHPRAAEIRNALQASIVTLIKEPKEANGLAMEEALEALNETLGEVANDATRDWALEQLANDSDALTHWMNPLVSLATGYVGIPPVTFRGGMCGNSTREEVAQFLQMEKKRITDARAKLLEKWQKVQPMSPKDRIRFSINAWRDYFGPLQNRYSDSFNPSGYLFSLMEPLVRFGEPAVPMLRAQQRVETELEAKGVWEVVITAITGKEDPALVKSLFDVRDPQGVNSRTKLACQIVVASGSKAWLKELEELQSRPGFERELPGHAIAISHGIEGLPSLEKASASNEGLIGELRAREAGKLEGKLRRYSILFWQ
ncbi:MAG TPA: hypothetical protein VGE67_07055 [Haloferula sp.]